MADAKRTDRLRVQIKEIISEIIQRKLKDPHVGMITITEVTVTRDLSEAVVFYSVFGDTLVRKETNKTLDRARGFIQSELGKTMKIRRVPSLRFEIDKSVDQGLRIQHLLDQIQENKPDDSDSH
ncbi:MAG: 30S ribosome-binding factor RbfA [bacterium]|nr:30S ribosome-binding factor RbfA [bacterium]